MCPSIVLQYYEFAYIKELAEPSRQLAQKVGSKEKKANANNDGTGKDESKEPPAAKDEWVDFV